MGIVSFNFSVTTFNKPSPPSESAFWEIKRMLNINPNLSLDSDEETFLKHFSIHLKVIIFGTIIAFISGNIGYSMEPSNMFANFMVLVMIISIITVISLLINFILEAPSYAYFIKQKKDYARRLKVYINNASTYNDFIGIYHSRESE